MTRPRRASRGRSRLATLGIVAALGLGGLLYAVTGEPASDAGAAAVLRVCADPDNLPFSSAAPGERGIYVELAELVAARLGARTEYVWWHTFYGKRAIRNTLLADRCDAFFGVPHRTDFMGRDLILSRPFIDVGWVVVARPHAAPSKIDDLRSRPVGVVFGSTAQLELATRRDFRTVAFRSDEQALEALAHGEVEAAIVWGPLAGYQNARKYAGAYRIVPLSGEGLQWRAAVAVRKGRETLRDEIDRALAALAPDIERLAERYGFPRGPAIALAAADEPSGTDADAIATGRSVFNQHCSHCHAPNAVSPEPSRDLRRLRLRYGAAASDVFYATVTRGRPDKGMPPWDNLDPAVVRRVWAFLDSVQTER